MNFICQLCFVVCSLGIFSLLLHAELCAYMNFLLLILSVMTWTVESKNAVKLSSGSTAPYGTVAEYMCSYQKGQVRAGDEAVLTLSQLGGITIERVSLSLRANASSGAGTVFVTCNDEQVVYQGVSWQNVSEDVEVLRGAEKGVNALSVKVVGTQNSIYVDAFTIEWSSGPAYTVTLMNGDTEYEVLNGTTVDLPMLEDLPRWHFLAWTDEPFHALNTRPETWIESGKYKPQKDVTLWAVYAYQAPIEQSIATTLHDDLYGYVNWTNKKAMSGCVSGGTVGAEDFLLRAENQTYEVVFDENGLATIRQEYVNVPAYIGFNGTQLADKASKWNVYHEGDKTAFYTVVNNKTYMLFPGYARYISHEDRYEYITQLLPVSDITHTPTVLVISGPAEEEPYFSCYPSGEGIESTREESCIKGEKKMINGQLYIIRNGKTYTVQGQEVKGESGR